MADAEEANIREAIEIGENDDGLMMVDTFKWFEIQERVFTRWVNGHLAKRGMNIERLKSGFKDGLMLLNLMEILADPKKIGRWNKKPNTIFQKNENITIALNFLAQQGVYTVNIGTDDIVESNIRIILGLIWTLICNFSINEPTEEKNDLLEWVRSKIPEYDIKNFTKDWNNGKAICALVNALRPGTIPDHWEKDPKDVEVNATQGIGLGEEKLGVLPLMQPQEMIHPKVDKNAMMTYIVQYRNLKPINPASLCKAYGPGLVDGLVDAEGLFTVEKPVSLPGTIAIKVIGSVGETEEEKAAYAEMPPIEYELIPEDDGKYAASYLPTRPGMYTVAVTYDGEHVPGSVFDVMINGEIDLGGAGTVRVYYTTVTGSRKVRGDIDKLEWMFWMKKVHLRPDFEPWIAVDAMEKKDRDDVFAKAGTRTLPMVYIDDKFIGGWDEIEELNEYGELDNLLKMDKLTLLTEEEHLHRMGLIGDDEYEHQAMKRTHYCGACGNPRLKDNSYCPDCGKTEPIPIDPTKSSKIKWFTTTKSSTKTVVETGADGKQVSKIVKQFAFTEEPTVKPLRKSTYTFKLADLTPQDVIQAAYTGDVDKIIGMADAGFDFNQRDEDGLLPVEVAIEQGQYEVVEVMMESGCKKPKIERDNVFMEVADGNLNVVKAMVAAGTNVTQADETGTTLYQAAMEEDQLEIANYLRSKGASTGTSAFTDMFMAVDEGDLKTVQDVIESGKVDVNGTDEDGHSCLDLAVAHGHDGLADTLKNYGAKGKNPYTAEQFAELNC